MYLVSVSRLVICWPEIPSPWSAAAVPVLPVSFIHWNRRYQRWAPAFGILYRSPSSLSGSMVMMPWSLVFSTAVASSSVPAKDRQESWGRGTWAWGASLLISAPLLVTWERLGPCTWGRPAKISRPWTGFLFSRERENWWHFVMEPEPAFLKL